jgi:hypothetical protein
LAKAGFFNPNRIVSLSDLLPPYTQVPCSLPQATGTL